MKSTPWFPSHSWNLRGACLTGVMLPFVVVSMVLLTATAARADRTRVCDGYGVVRDRSDYEVPLLPRRSIARCARSYQTLYQTYRVRSAPRPMVDRGENSSSSSQRR